ARVEEKALQRLFEELAPDGLARELCAGFRAFFLERKAGLAEVLLHLHDAIALPAADLIGNRTAPMTDHDLQGREAVQNVRAGNRGNCQTLFGDEVLVVRLAPLASAAVNVDRKIHRD